VAIPESFLQELIERNDIVDVVGSYVHLTKRSGSNQFGLCPFHSEKTGSFAVNASRQTYHCFGCGKGGGVINFIMEIEGLSFPDAVEMLAKRAGMQMPEQENSSESRKRKRLLELNRDAARFFWDCLSSEKGKAAQEYMARRGISGKTAKSFGLGYAPDSWDSLLKAMRDKGYRDFELFDAGLAKKGKNGGYYDVFRNRLMFPVIDVKGDVIAFSGRTLGDDAAKYMNSPETAVFSKSRNLFAMNLAKKSKCGYIILVEGNVDVVSLHQAGFDSAVASLGTSLTPEQARLISRYSNEVVIAYDGDGAGTKAAERAIRIFEKLDVRVRVLALKDAKDPDEYIKLKGADAFRNLLESSENHMEYRLQSIRSRYDLSNDEQRIEYVKEAERAAAALSDKVKREVYSKRIAETARLSEQTVMDDVERLYKSACKRAQKDTQRKLDHPEKMFQPSDRELRYENPESAAAEEGLIRLLCLGPETARGKSLPDKSDFSSPHLADIYGAVKARIDNGDAVNPPLLSAQLTPQESSLLSAILNKPCTLKNSEKALEDYIERIMQQKSYRSSAEDLREMANRLKEKKAYRGTEE